MNCHDARELFSALLDEALTPEERARLEAHLATCAECGRELDRFRRTVALVQALPPEHAPPGFVDRVTAAARPEPWTARLARGLLVPWRVKLPLEAAALLLVGGLAVLVFRGTEEQQRAAQVGDQRTYQERTATLEERPAATPEVVSQAAEQSAARADETQSALRKTPASVPTTASPRAPAEPPAPAAPQAPTQSQPLAPPPVAQPQEPLEAKAAPRQAPVAREAMEPSRDVVTGRASEPRTEVPARRESGSAVESDRRQKSARAEAPVGSGTVASKDAPGKLSDSGARERKDQEGVARDAPVGRLRAARGPTEADIRGTLAVADARATAARIEAIAGRLNGVVAGRHDDGESLLLQVVVGRERYDELVRELTRLGQWRTETEVETPSLPLHVRVAIRVAVTPSR